MKFEFILSEESFCLSVYLSLVCECICGGVKICTHEISRYICLNTENRKEGK